MLGEFKRDQHVFVHIFRKKLLFDISGSTDFLSTQMRTFLANLFQNSLCKSHARRSIIILGLNWSSSPKSKHFKYWIYIENKIWNENFLILEENIIKKMPLDTLSWWDYATSCLIHKLYINLKWIYYTMKSNFFCTERELLNIKITLPSAKLDMVGSRLVSNDLLFLVRV